MFFIRLVFIAFLGIFSYSHAEKLNKFGDPWCVDRIPSPDKEQLQCLKSTAPTLELIKSLNEIVHGKRKPLRLGKSYLTKNQYLKLFKNPILVYRVSYAEHGSGYEVDFIFKNQLEHDFFAMVDYLENGTYKVRFISDDGPNKESAKLRKHLHQKEFLDFWLINAK